MIFAKNEFANKELSRQIQQRDIQKEYLTVVCGKPEKQEDILEDYLRKLRTINMSKITTSDDKLGKAAKLQYRVLETIYDDEYGNLSLLKIKLFTGRHHQIRVQLSNYNVPIWGDNKYNKKFVKKKSWTQIALWSHKLRIKHPKTGEYTEFKAIPAEYPFERFNIKKYIDIDD